MSRRLALAFPVILGAFAAGSPPAAAQRMDAVHYTMQRGDDLYTLGQRYLLRPGDHARVQTLNKITDPRRIPAGRVITIPRHLLRHTPVEARIAAWRGEVNIERAGQTQPARPGMILLEGDRIVTGANASLTLRMAGGSITTLPSQSALRLVRLRRLLLTGEVERLFALEQGRIRSSVRPVQNRGDDFRISTPGAVSAVRGTDFRVSYDTDRRRSITEVIEGKVAVANRAGPLTVTSGFGAIATAAGAPVSVALLPAPVLREPGRRQEEAELRFSAEPVAEAVAYRFKVAADAGFIDVLSETTAPETEARIPSVPDGALFVRVSAIDNRGVEGMPATYGFVRRRFGISGGLKISRSGGGQREYVFRWFPEGEAKTRFRFQLMQDSADGPVVVDQVGIMATELAVIDLPPGVYFWRVQALRFMDGAVEAKWSPLEQFTISQDE